MRLFVVLSVCIAVSSAYPNLVDLAAANNATKLVALLNSAGLADILKDPSQGRKWIFIDSFKSTLRTSHNPSYDERVWKWMNVCMDIFAPEFRLTFCYIYLTILYNVKVVSLVDKIIEYESYNHVQPFVLFKCPFYVLWLLSYYWMHKVWRNNYNLGMKNNNVNYNFQWFYYECDAHLSWAQVE